MPLLSELAKYQMKYQYHYSLQSEALCPTFAFDQNMTAIHKTFYSATSAFFRHTVITALSSSAIIWKNQTSIISSTIERIHICYGTRRTEDFSDSSANISCKLFIMVYPAAAFPFKAGECAQRIVQLEKH